MISSWDGNAVLAEVISNPFDVKEGIVHLAELLISAPVVRLGLGGLFHPLVMVFALTAVVLRRSCAKWEKRTIAVV